MKEASNAATHRTTRQLNVSTSALVGAFLAVVVPAAANDNFAGLPPSPKPSAASVAANDNVALLSVATVTDRIVWAIGVYETNRGGNQPITVESSLDTVASMHASLRTIEQATILYVIDEIARNGTLSQQARPPLTRAEIALAAASCAAVTKLLEAVSEAHAAGTAFSEFIKQNAALIAAAHLQDHDVEVMFSAVGLKHDIDGRHLDVSKGKLTLDGAVDSIATSDRLGLSAASLRAYIRKPANWGENQAAWQRKAVLALPDGIGQRLEAVAVGGRGNALANATVGRRVRTLMTERMRIAEQDLVTVVSQRNNPKEHGYGANVWATYKRLFLSDTNTTIPRTRPPETPLLSPDPLPAPVVQGE